MEKVYRSMKTAGIMNLVIGISLIIGGLASGICLIVSGSKLLNRKNTMTF